MLFFAPKVRNLVNEQENDILERFGSFAILTDLISLGIMARYYCVANVSPVFMALVVVASGMELVLKCLILWYVNHQTEGK